MIRCLLAMMAALHVMAADPAVPADEVQHRALLDRLCLECHASEKKKGDFELAFVAKTDPASHDAWENVRNAIAAGDMPPHDKPQPSPAERDALVAWIDRLLDGPSGDAPSDPGWVTTRRLTRVEFNRTIADLLGLAGDHAESFPPDSAGGSGSFDNQADTLYVSPLLMERVLEVTLPLVEKTPRERLHWSNPEPDKKKGMVTAQTQRKAGEVSLTTFLPRAWRRPVAKAEVQALLKVYDRGVKRSIAHDDALRLTYAAALTAPHFLFRTEQVRPGNEVQALSPYELANRLSYFLWSTMPDEELFARAADGSLVRAEVITAQVTRMLAHPKATVLPRAFMGQWLGTDGLASGLGPDPKLVRGYSAAVKAAMMQEPAEFFRHLLQRNGPLTDLIDSDYVYVNEDLADLYGLSGASGERFTRVTVSDGRRGGLVTMAGVLAITSRPARTSPVLRGKWILQELLSYPPPPPPPNVPPLPETGDGTLNVGPLRARLERHRDDPNCRSCHQRIDPLGFGLENFDQIGRWRTRGDVGEPLDTTGTMPDGARFDGPQQLKKLLKERQDRVIQTVVERMLVYALGRQLARHDRTTVRQITARLAANRYGAAQLIHEVALSLPFRYQRDPAARSVIPFKPDQGTTR
jgi:hypothetical protein